MNLSTNGYSVTATAAHTPGLRRFEFRLEADPFWLSPVRSFVTDLGLRADLDLDSVADLTMAVDEAVAQLIAAAGEGQRVTGHVEIARTFIAVCVSLPSRQHLATDTFGWRVLRALADHVELAPDGTGIVLVKERAPDSG